MSAETNYRTEERRNSPGNGPDQAHDCPFHPDDLGGMKIMVQQG
jgi:hypothetical protein